MLPPVPMTPVADPSGVVPAAPDSAATAANGQQFAKVLDAVSAPAGNGSDKSADARAAGAANGHASVDATAEPTTEVVEGGSEGHAVDTAAAAVQASVLAANLAVANLTQATVATPVDAAVTPEAPEADAIEAVAAAAAAAASASTFADTDAAIAAEVIADTALAADAAIAADAALIAAAAAGIAAPATETAPTSTTPVTTPVSGEQIDVTTGEPVVIPADRTAVDGDVPAAPVAALPIEELPVDGVPSDDVAPTVPVIDADAPVAVPTGEVATTIDTDDVVTALADNQTKAAIDGLSSTMKTDAPASPLRPSAATPQTPMTAPEPYKQVVNIVAPLRQLADGDYQMTLRLNPEHLGRVEVAVTLTNGQISMQLNSDNASARQMLRDSMNELRASLESSGLNAGSLDVGTRDAGQQPGGGRNGANASSAANWTEADNDNFFARLATVATPPSVTDGRLDARL